MSLRAAADWVLCAAVGLSSLCSCLQVAPALTCIAGAQARAPRNHREFDPFRYLPPGAKIENPPRDIVFADLDGDGEDEIVISYTVPKYGATQTDIAELKWQGRDYNEVWSDNSDLGWSFDPPTCVCDLNRTGRAQIVAYRSVGASCGGTLGIYECQHGQMTNIFGAPQGTCVDNLTIKDLDGDGVPEIIFTGTNYGTNPDIYWWSGKKYVRSNCQFASYYDGLLKDLLGYINSDKRFPISARLTWAHQVVQIYLWQHRYIEAIRFCEHALTTVDDAHLNAPEVLTGSTKAFSDAFRLNSKVTLHRFMAEAYHEAGQLPQARKENEESLRLQSEAKRLDPNPSPIRWDDWRCQ